MPNENEKNLGNAGEEDIEEEIDELPNDENGDEEVDWKEEAAKYRGIASRYKTKRDKTKKDLEDYKTQNPPKEPDKKEEPQPQDKKEFDLAEKSYLLSSGIKKSEFSLVLEECQKTGRPINVTLIDEILESPYFQEQLEKARSEVATPGAPGRGGGAAANTVEYWLNKGQFPPDTPENKELRQKVAAALAKAQQDESKFTSRPIV